MTASDLSTAASVAIQRREYLESLWWNMHHSESADRITVALTSYYDDSGIDAGSPVTALGGPVMVKESFIQFDAAWRQLLYKYKVPSPLHMKNWSQIGLYPEMKIPFLTDVAYTINRWKFWSFSVTVPQAEFQDVMPVGTSKEFMSPFAFAFLASLLTNQYACDYATAADLTMAYVIDSGSASEPQLQSAHHELRRLEKEKKKTSGVVRLGSMTPHDDEEVSALQAADVISWAARKRQVEGLKGEFAPLERLFNEESEHAPAWQGFHAHLDLPLDAIKLFAAPIHNWLYLNGRMPEFGEMLR